MEVETLVAYGAVAVLLLLAVVAFLSTVGSSDKTTKIVADIAGIVLVILALGIALAID